MLRFLYVARDPKYYSIEILQMIARKCILTGALAGLVALGCTVTDPAATGESASTTLSEHQPIEPSPTTPQPEDDASAESSTVPIHTAFTYDKDHNRALLDTRIPPPQKRTFWLGLGSVTLETVSATDNVLIIRYTQEVEGGYSVSECEADISPTPLIFQFGFDGTPGEAPQSLRNCKPMRSGNVHFDLQGTETSAGE